MSGAPPASRARRAWTPRRREAAGIALIAVAGLAVQLAGIARPSFWYDEAATVSGASRSFSSLRGLTENVDAVHGAYYVVMNLVRRLFGADEFAMRAPSAIAVAATALAVYAIARHFGPPSVSMTAAVLFLALPRMTWAATEARSFALATLLVSLATLVLLRMLAGRAAVWLLFVYALLSTAAVFVFLHSALVIMAHAVTVLITRAAKGRRVRIIAAMAVAGALCVPLALRVASQRAQLGGTREIDASTSWSVLVGQFLPGQPVAAIALWVVVLACAAHLVVLARSGRRPAASDADEPAVNPFALVLPWLILPTAAIVLYSIVQPSIYQERALTMSAPALAVLAAILIRRALRPRAAVLVTILLLVTMIPGYASARTPHAKGTDWRDAAVALSASSDDGDAVVFLSPVDVASYTAQIALLYPDAVDGLQDIALAERGVDRPYLFDHRLPLDELGDRVADVDVVHVVRDADIPVDVVAEADGWLRAHGFRPATRTELELTTIDRYTRGDGAPAAVTVRRAR